MALSRREKAKKVLNPLLYLALILGICFSASLIFNKVYYEEIIVEGESMRESFKGNEYGLTDTTERAKKKISRLDIITTFYSWQPGNTDLKIKRVLALPGDTIEIVKGDVYITPKGNPSGRYHLEYCQFFDPNVTSDSKNNYNLSPLTMGEDEYWCMGDNWFNSNDCYDSKTPVKYKDIEGVLVAISGTYKRTSSGRIKKTPYVFKKPATSYR